MDYYEHDLCYLVDTPTIYSFCGIRVRSRGLLKDGLCLDDITGTRNKIAAIALALNGINGHK